MNLMHAFQQDNPLLMSVFSLLGLMSLASWYVIFWKGWSLRRERMSLARFRTQCTTPDWPLHTQFKQSGGSGVTQLLQETAQLQPLLDGQEPPERKEILSMHLSQRLDTVRSHLDQGLTILASIGSSAPFIGLFGTVWGIYGTLTRITAEGNATLNVVAGPMGEALVATAIGLFAAIPAVLAYNAYVRLNRLLVQDLRHVAEQLTTYLSLSSAHEPVKLARSAR